jgi:hypothetical protein
VSEIIAVGASLSVKEANLFNLIVVLFSDLAELESSMTQTILNTLFGMSVYERLYLVKFSERIPLRVYLGWHPYIFMKVSLHVVVLAET